MQVQLFRHYNLSFLDDLVMQWPGCRWESSKPKPFVYLVQSLDVEFDVEKCVNIGLDRLYSVIFSICRW